MSPLGVMVTEGTREITQSSLIAFPSLGILSCRARQPQDFGSLRKCRSFGEGENTAAVFIGGLSIHRGRELVRGLTATVRIVV